MTGGNFRIHGLRVILAGLLRGLKRVVARDLKERRVGLCAGEVFCFSCGFAGAWIGGLSSTSMPSSVDFHCSEMTEKSRSLP